MRPNASWRRRAALAIGVAAAAALPTAAAPDPPEAPTPARSGDFRQRVLLGGELRAARALPVMVPRTSIWNVEIRWLIEDGAEVEPGDRLVEFDNSALASRLEELRQKRIEAEHQLTKGELEARGAAAELEFAVESRRVELEKARLAAEVPGELLSRLEAEERRLALRRAESELDKALAELAAGRSGWQADLAIRRLTLEKAARELRFVEEGLSALSLTAPRAGVVLVADHPWEGRKLQVGDTVRTGLTVLTLPDLASMEVGAVLADVDDGSIAPGLEASCRLEAYPDTAYPCRVEEISPVARRSGPESLRRHFPVTVALLGADPARMRPGMSVLVEVVTEVRPGARLLPREAVDFGLDPPRPRGATGPSPPRIGPCNGLDCVLLAGGGALPPAAAAPPPPLPPGPPPGAGARDRGPAPAAEVERRTRAWAEAWAGQRAGDYLAFYADGFRPPEGEGRAGWEERRRRLIESPEWIEIVLRELEIETFGPDRATARFIQEYRSDRFGDRVRKRLDWGREEGAWKILLESAEKLPPEASP